MINPATINSYGTSDARESAPNAISPRLKLAHSDSGEPGACRRKGRGSSSATRFVEVWP